MASSTAGFFALSAALLLRASLAAQVSVRPQLQRAFEERVSSGIAVLQKEQAANAVISAKHLEDLEQTLKEAPVDAAKDAKAAVDAAALAMELEAAKQREVAAWAHSADLVEVITKLNDALRSEKEGRAKEVRELSAQLDAAAKNATAIQAEISHVMEEQTALRAHREMLLKEREK